MIFAFPSTRADYYGVESVQKYLFRCLFSNFNFNLETDSVLTTVIDIEIELIWT